MPVEMALTTTDSSDEQFRGTYERFLLFAMFALKSIDQGDDPAAIALRQIASQVGTKTAGAQTAMRTLMTGLGFTTPFIDNFVLLEPAYQHDFEIFVHSLLNVKSLRLFQDAYTGTGCLDGYREVIALAVQNQPNPAPAPSPNSYPQATAAKTP